MNKLWLAILIMVNVVFGSMLVGWLLVACGRIDLDRTDKQALAGAGCACLILNLLHWGDIKYRKNK